MTLIQEPVGLLSSTEEAEEVSGPLLCTHVKYNRDDTIVEPLCGAVAHWEALCMGCGRVFRRCSPHLVREAAVALRSSTGQCFRCVTCDIPVFPEQFGRI